MSQHQEKARIIRFEKLSDDNYRLTLNAPRIAALSGPGHFVMIHTGATKDPLLRRPFSIHQVSGNGELMIYFRNVGRGTDILTKKTVGESLDLFGPLGKGYEIKSAVPACLVGGGLGIAPLLFLAGHLFAAERDCSKDLIILGGRSIGDVEPLVDDFSQFGFEIECATDDGSYGRKGLVTDILKSVRLPEKTEVYACGPDKMLGAVHLLCEQRNFGCQVSVESVMACGMGACLGCNIPARKGGYVHVCVDGPVFKSEDLVWD